MEIEKILTIRSTNTLKKEKCLCFEQDLAASAKFPPLPLPIIIIIFFKKKNL